MRVTVIGLEIYIWVSILMLTRWEFVGKICVILSLFSLDLVKKFSWLGLRSFEIFKQGGSDVLGLN